MKKYELTYLISPDLSEEEAGEIQKKITFFIEQEKGILTQINFPVKKVLGQMIKKKNLVYLASINFELNPADIKNLEEIIKKETNVLRYIILIKKLTKRIIQSKRPLKEKPTFKKSTEKVGLKEIEKKLEEILKDEPR